MQLAYGSLCCGLYHGCRLYTNRLCRAFIRVRCCGDTLPEDPAGARLAEKVLYTKTLPFWSMHVSCQSTGASLPSALLQVPSALVTCVGARRAVLGEGPMSALGAAGSLSL